MWAAAAAAAFVGQSQAVSPQPEAARPWLVAAAILGYVAIRLLEANEQCPGWTNSRHSASGSSDRLARASLSRRRRVGGLAMMGLGGAYALVAAALVFFRLPESTATWTWLFGLLAALVGAALLSCGRWRLPWPRTAEHWLETAALIAIFGIAIALPNMAIRAAV